MPLKDLLVCIDATATAEARLRLAFNLARAHRAHLAGVYILPEMPTPMPLPAGAQAPVALPPFGVLPTEAVTGLGPSATVAGGPVAGVLREAEAADTVEQRFMSELRLAGVEGEWHVLAAGEAGVIIELAKTVDLTILGRASTQSGTLRPEEVAAGAARPILVVPDTGVEIVGRHALVAWDETREAVRAVNDALPLLEKADAVTVMFVGAQEASLDEHRPSVERVVLHLQRHGITARAEETVHGELRVSDVLLSRAADLGADLIVAGAYHHSQLREAILGGVSRELLDHMTVPVLMSH
jgi:nucleotide-binding universal stress UspA family protein